MTAPHPPQEAAISVGAPHPVYGHAPWTLQVGGCGAPGKRIYFTPDFLDHRNHSAVFSDRLFAQEWAKYRWGVFEEYGHADDPLYPSYHRTDTRTHVPTGCSNVPVVGIPSSCDPYHQACHFHPQPLRNIKVTSSLLFLHHLPNVNQFCDETTHDSTAPTKHNALCGGRSAWQVMSQHNDFKHGPVGAGPVRNTQPLFNYIRPAAHRYVIVVEDTAVMNAQKRWDLLRKAVRRMLVYDIPPGEKVGVVIFDSTASTTLPLIQVPDALEDRQRLATVSLPRTPSQVIERSKCILCGLEKAVEMLEKDGGSAAGGVIFLISSGSPFPLSSYDLELLRDLVVPRHVQVVPVLYPMTVRSPTPTSGVEQLAKITGTQWYAVADEGIGYDSKVSMMVALMRALYSALRMFLPNADTLPLLVHQQEFPGGIGSVSQGQFVLDGTLGGEMRFSITYYDLGHVGNMIVLIDPLGQNVDTLNLQEEDGDVNMIFVTVKNAMPGRWRYKVENRADSHQSLYIHVVATPASNSSSLTSTPSISGGQYTNSPTAITLEAWTSETIVSSNTSITSGPVVIYGKVWSGRGPVVGAQVEAMVQRLGMNSTGSAFQPLVFTLHDNGACADITANDGVYSRYLPVLATGRYTVRVKATDHSGRAALVVQDPAALSPRLLSGHFVSSGRRGRAVPSDQEGPYCCGSRMPYTRTQDAGMIAREDIVGVVDVLEEMSPYPPSRVTDLRVIVNPAAMQVTLHWTAPGNQLDHGKASHYELVFGRNPLEVASGKGTRKTDVAVTEAASKHTEYSMKPWHHHGAIYYIVIRAVSHVGLPAPWSPMASFFVPSPATTTEINTRGSTQAGATGGSVGNLEAPRRELLSTRDLLAIVGAACGFLLIVLVLSVYYVVIVTRRRRRQQEKIPKSDSMSPPEPESETDSINKPTDKDLVMTETLKEPRPLSPVQSWPASKLLNEHERRRPIDGQSSGPVEGMHLPPDLGVPANPHPFLYHTMNGRYIEDNIPFDGGSLISTQPSDSMLVYRLDTGATETARPAASGVWNPHHVMHSPSQQQQQMVPPQDHHELHQQQIPQEHSATTLPHDRRRRNVTQV
ncbi:calcium-activated chloride channel regulator 1 [Hyalella azteca]|uniref:Calcium-activated chloride channel regulator 1 n=1 Tax=Hyalella azteca TaxID=294128 RepID=A0A8B7NL24_HYAAZ|nr:calcium-activated chloride channel regulator 1 [Hyalella azteca]